MPILEGTSEERDPIGHMLERCLRCKKCSNACPSRAYGGIDIGEIMSSVSRGIAGLENDHTIWLCAGCRSCIEQCPNGLDPTSIVTYLRSSAAMTGNIPSWLKDEASRFLHTGLSFPVTNMTYKIRENLGLERPEVSEKAKNDIAILSKLPIMRRLDIGP